MSTVTLGFDGTEDDELGLLSLDDEGVVELLVVEELELFCDVVFLETVVCVFSVNFSTKPNAINDKITHIRAIIKHLKEMSLFTLLFLIDEIIRNTRFNKHIIVDSSTTRAMVS